jgi:microcin C transport system ATP-binding protein
MENLLKVRNLRVEFVTEKGMATAVKDANLAVRQGETVVLAGESGSGKSVTAMAVAGLLPAGGILARGAVYFRGTDLTTLGEAELERIRGREIAYVFQEPSSYLDPVYTIGDQVGELLGLHRGLTGARAREECLRLLDLVRIREPERVRNSYPHQLSGGMNQRVFTAMALACAPKLLIADEPTTALDVTVEDQIIRLLCELKAQLGFSLFFITHNLAIARRIADTVFIMHQGEVVESGDSRSIFASPQHAHTKELIAAYEKIGKI